MNEIIVHSEKKSKNKWHKKEKKILGMFQREYLTETFNFDLNNQSTGRTLLIDNRDCQIQFSNDSIIDLLCKAIKNHNKQEIIEDLFVLPNKKFILLKSKTIDVCRRIHNLNFDNKFNSIFNFYRLPDSVFDLVTEKCQPLVDSIYQLFSPGNQPQGLRIIDDFIDETEEQLLLKFAESYFDLAESEDKISRMKNRRAIHFGRPFDYDRNTITNDPQRIVEDQLPNVLMPFLDRFSKFLPENPDQLTINHYDAAKGDHIPFHCDTHSMCTKWILSLSLGSDIVMSWKSKKVPEKSAFTLLSARSLMIMSDEARYYWEHGIQKTPSDIVPVCHRIPKRLSLLPRTTRYSFTFRKSTSSGYVCQCDECKINPDKLDPLQSNPKKLESNYVHETYEQIADHFSSTRYKCWPKVVEFLESLPSGSIVLDVGCGNGRFLSANPSIVTIGTDRSWNLLNICRQRNLETFMDDCLQLDQTLRHGIFDGIICIAVIHHMATDERRVRAMHSILNLLAIDGLALIYVWAFEQRLAGDASKYLKSDQNDGINQSTMNGVEKIRSSHQLPVHQNRTDFREQDLLVPWMQKSKKSMKKFYRFYHVFKKGELEKLIQQVGQMETGYGIRIEQSYYDQGNWCVVVRKNENFN